MKDWGETHKNRIINARAMKKKKFKYKLYLLIDSCTLDIAYTRVVTVM